MLSGYRHVNPRKPWRVEEFISLRQQFKSGVKLVHIKLEGRTSAAIKKQASRMMQQGTLWV